MPPAWGAGLSGRRRELTESVRDIPDQLGIAARGGHRPAVIVRRTLTPTERDAPIEFQVAFQMRSFPELSDRLSRGELISAEEMAANYFPLESEYGKTIAWLIRQGLTVTLRDPNRLAVFVQAPVARIADAFQMTFARVDTDDGEFTSAVSAPSIPDAEASSILGVNGLQPHLRPHKHARLQLVPKNSTSGNGPPFLPSQIARAYHADGLGVTGAGQKIAIVIDTFPATSDLTSFWSLCNVPQSLSNIEFVQAVTGTLPVTSGEETLDVEWTSAMAPAAKVRVYATTSLSFVNIDKAYQKIISDLPTQPTLHQVSLSYGAGELGVSSSQLNTDANYFASLASAGVTVLVSSGDGGSSPGASGHDHTGSTQTESPASDKNVTAVGGTNLSVSTATGDTTSESAWYDGGGGISWKFPRPTWQIGAGVPVGTKRLVPDVAAVGDATTGGYLIWQGQAYIVGGTSWSAPVWAGFCAIINESRTNAGLSSLGLLGPKIYPLLGTACFVDIIAGSNGPNGVYNAGAGYDLCTGLGVPNVSALLQALTPIAPFLTSQPQNQSVSVGQTVSLSVSATGTAPLAYQWQNSMNSGTSWTSLTNVSPYSGVTTATLQLAPASALFTGAQYRCLVSNSFGSVTSGTATLTVISPPTITSAVNAAATFKQGFTYLISASNAPLAFSATGLPSGLTLDPVTGVIAGSPTVVGQFTVSLGATNAAGTGNAVLALTVAPDAASVTLSNLVQSYDGTEKSATVTTIPAGLAVTLTCDASATPPIFAASYAVVATVTELGYTGSASGTLLIARSAQVINFPALPVKNVGDADFVLAAAATSGLPLDYRSDNPAVATMAGETVTIVGPGTANLTASQAGNGNYLPALSVTQALQVESATQAESSDAPSMPLWALVALASLLFVTTLPVLRKKGRKLSAQLFG